MVGSSSSSGVPDTPYQFWARFISGGVAASIAEICTIPLDTAKVRMQLQNKATGIKYTNAFQCMGTIAKEEGALALWKGLAPGILRQMVFASIRIGLYEPVRNVYHGGKQGDPSLLTKIAAGLTTGCVGIMIANPTDLVKVRVQAEGRLPPGTAKRYKGTIDAFRTIARVEGFRGLWTGVVPNMFRNSIINAAELASYDQFKQGALKFGMKDSISTHLLCALGAGFVATVFGSPMDVVKTRVMNTKLGPDGKPVFNGMVDCIVKTMRNEGPMAFYNGFLPNFLRIGSWNVVMFLSFEQLKKHVVGN